MRKRLRLGFVNSPPRPETARMRYHATYPQSIISCLYVDIVSKSVDKMEVSARAMAFLMFAFHCRLRQKVPGSIMFQQRPLLGGEGVEGSSRGPGASGTEGSAGVSRGGGPAGTQGRHGRARTARALGLEGRPGKDGHAWFSGHQRHSRHTGADRTPRPPGLGRLQRY